MGSVLGDPRARPGPGREQAIRPPSLASGAACSITLVSAPVLAGAEPFSSAGGPEGALVIHGFTGNVFSMRGIATALAGAGLTVEAPLLPGHGTAVADMLPTRFEDWAQAAEAAYRDLASRCASVAVVGLSMGGTLACWLGE